MDIVEYRDEDVNNIRVLVDTMRAIASVYSEHSSHRVVSGSKYLDSDIVGYTLHYINEERTKKFLWIFPYTQERTILDVWEGFNYDGDKKYVSCEVYMENIRGIAREYIGKYAARFNADVKMKLNYRYGE